MQTRRWALTAMFLLLLGATLGVLAARALADEDTDDPLTGTLWRLESLFVDGQAITAGPTAGVTARFDDGRIIGSGGCNLYQGDYRVRGDRLELAELSLTARACVEQRRNELEQQYMRALGSLDHYSLAPGRLEFLGADGAPLARFVNATPLRLTDSEWRVEGIAAPGGGLSSPLEGTELTMLFTADGVIRGSTGCNSYSGSYERAGGVVALTDLSVTERACMTPDGIMQQETQFLEALRQIEGVAAELSAVELLAADGTVLLILSPTQ